MGQNDTDDAINALTLLEGEDVEANHVETTALAALNRSEIEVQLGAAHKYRRSISAFLREAKTIATLTKPVAETCIYSTPRGGKSITGPSVRLAEICASAYGNLHVGARVVDVDDKHVTAQGVAWDLEKNLRVTVEVRRSIVGKSGRFNDDMITVTGNAAASIALRNAVFRVIPRAYIDTIYADVKSTAVGDATTLDARRRDVVGRLMKMGASQERIFATVGAKNIEDVGLDSLEVLIGLGTAIKNQDKTIDEAFPPVFVPASDSQPEDGRRISIRGKAKAEAPDAATLFGEPAK